jgi:hypothetical protein
MVTVTLVNACAPYLPLQHWHTRAPWERVNLKCTVELAVTLFTLAAHGEPRDTRQRRSPPQHGHEVESCGSRGSVWQHVM